MMTNSSGPTISLLDLEEEQEEDSAYSSKIIYSREVALRRQHSKMMFYHQEQISNAHLLRYGALTDYLIPSLDRII